MTAKLALLLPLAPLAACDKGEPTRVTINTDGNATEKGSVQMGDGNFKADLKIPGLAAIGRNMEFNGVKLYPKSAVSDINIKGDDSQGEDRVAIRFTAPADRAKVGDWFQKQFTDNRFDAQATPTGYAGKTDDGEPFTLELTPAGAETKGEFRMGKAGS